MLRQIQIEFFRKNETHIFLAFTTRMYENNTKLLTIEFGKKITQIRHFRALPKHSNY
ncbi:hypothetical protein LEP1GSC024_0954 [Leptospira noguchii str. 2001034031]|uniref:Uncharacterized protein n=1 Tax=Leptospira noguchii str. 2001034031 TaxID=1193053 RepID=M6YMI5_9LEPT|nr:hypothetical protein LEP1GSC024_0954 [Leptospira noguchii str. 2001034031]